MNPHLDIAPEVAAALAAGEPVVALETSILAHGLPYPQNVETAAFLEETVRRGGAVPATIAVIAGRIRIGLSASERELLGTARDVMKLSRADLGFAVAERRHGATTVAATMICAHMAGIRVFATGGIGGVHRGVELTMDVSADLDELARTPVAVVCAGAKSVLDLPKTLEALETRGVPVIGYRTSDFPSFWSRSSGLPAPLRLDTAEAVARFLAVQRELGLRAGALICNPIPSEHDIPAAELDGVIARAVAEAERQAIGGKKVTPFLLDRIVEMTAGRSLAGNRALVANNAAAAAEIARAVAMLTKEAGRRPETG